nr:MAG TPA: Protein gp18.1, prophage tail protein gp18.7A [Caudoviricetes sp.]
MVLVVHDPAVGDIREIEEFELDLAFGSDENALKLEARAGDAPEEGQFVFIDGTEYGGVIDQESYEAGREATDSILCRGRTWHGILAGKRLLPDSGSGYLSVDGKAGEVLASLVARMGLSGLFSAAPDDTAVSYTFERFCDGYSGLKAMAKANGRKVAMRRKGGKVEISLPPAVDYANKVDSDLLDFKLTSVHRCVNHLVCAGTGELEDRAVVHFYADAAGNVSHTQSLFGVDEISALYDYSNADEEKLEEEGRKKLQEYQTQGSVEVEAHDDIDVDVGDVISARDNAHGRTVTATVAKKIVKVSRGVATYSYEVGSETTTKTSSSGTAESSGGGHAYLAGKGLTLSDYTFSAEVDAAALAAVESKAVAAEKGASDAAAAARANAKAIAGKQDKLTAGANVTIDGATIRATDTTYDEATTSKAGLMSASDKAALDGIANVKDWVVSRGENLVSNGFATLGDNTNFSSFAFDGADAFQSGGSFSKKSTSPSTAFTDELMPYDPSSAYRLSYYIKSDCADARYYDILDCYDIDGLQITDGHVIFTPGSTTRLAADLKPGDSSVSVESAAGFNSSDTDGRQYFNRGLMFWDYANSYGYAYAPETYTRNRYERLWTSNASAIDKAGNRIMLDRAWSGPTVRKGTSVSQTENGATFVYGNAYFTVPAGEWTRKEVTLEGRARPGTAYVKIGWLIPNAMGGASSVTTKLTGVSFGAVPAYAKSATTASRVADGGAGTANAARHVWFSDSLAETARNHSDAFRYNPVGNILSCNVSGNAATAGSAESAARLAASRTVSISGAVNGSATWDGSGDLAIVVAGDSAAAGFLAAHPVGFYAETGGADPNDYGGTWERAPSVGPHTWLRTK